MSMETDAFSLEGLTRASGELVCTAMINLCIKQCLLCIRSVSYFTVLYPKHKHLVQNELPHNAKKVGPISNSRQVFSKK